MRLWGHSIISGSLSTDEPPNHEWSSTKEAENAETASTFASVIRGSDISQTGGPNIVGTSAANTVTKIGTS